MSCENCISAWRVTRGSDDGHWTHSQWGDTTKWQGWSTDYTTHVYSDANYLKGWCYVDNEHDSDWGSAWISSMPAVVEAQIARLDDELESLKQKLAHDESMDRQSVTFVNDRTSCGGEFNIIESNRATRATDDDHWTHSQWGDARKWQSWSTDYTTHVHSDADYLQGWCYADNEHDSDCGCDLFVLIRVCCVNDRSERTTSHRMYDSLL